MLVKPSQARELLKSGRFSDAADSIQAAAAGSQAEPVVAQWVADARARALAEQNVKLLQAHTASAIAAGLAKMAK